MITRRSALIAPLALAACAKAAAPTKIRFATDWRAEAEQGGFYQAVALGEFKKRGLDVELIQGGPSVNVPQLLASGAVQFGIGSNSFIVMNLAAEGAPVKAVAAFFQKDPQVLIAHPDAGVNRLEDLKGRPILLADASVGAFWVWLKARYGFSDSQVRKYAYSLAPYLSDKWASVQGYVTSEPYQIEKETHVAPKVFLLADEGYPSYGAMVLTTQSLMTAKPDVVRAFVAASQAGWVSYLTGDPSPAHALILKDNPEMTPDLLQHARQSLLDYHIIDGGDAKALGLGAMTEARWRQFFTDAASQGVYKPSLDYRIAFDASFLPGAGAH